MCMFVHISLNNHDQIGNIEGSRLWSKAISDIDWAGLFTNTNFMGDVISTKSNLGNIGVRLLVASGGRE